MELGTQIALPDSYERDREHETSNLGWKNVKIQGGNVVNDRLLRLWLKFRDLADSEEGQDMVEYALVVAMIAFGAVAGMGKLAASINHAFSNTSTKLGGYIS